jgi:hypothetical protein
LSTKLRDAAGMGKYEPGVDLLAEAVRRRRERLGVTQEDVVRVGGPSIGTMRTIENAQGDSFRPKTLRSLDKALGWAVGTSEVLMDGSAHPTISLDVIVEDSIKRVTSMDLDRYQIPYRVVDGPGLRGIEISGPLPRGSESSPAIAVTVDPPPRSGTGVASLDLGARSTSNVDDLLQEAIAITARLPYNYLLQLRSAVDATVQATRHQLHVSLATAERQLTELEDAREYSHQFLLKALEELKAARVSEDPRLVELAESSYYAAEGRKVAIDRQVEDQTAWLIRTQQMIKELS